MKIGLIGLQNSGKTTIFNALTGQDLEVTSYASQKVEPNLGIVEVIDDRITKLSAIYKPKKTIYANIEYIDFAGFAADNNTTIPANILALAKTTDALALVVQNFKGEIREEPNITGDIDIIESELMMSDLIVAENRMEKIILSKKRGIKDASLLIEESAIKKVIEQLNGEQALRDLELAPEEKKAIRGFQFLSQKPMMIIINSSIYSICYIDFYLHNY